MMRAPKLDAPSSSEINITPEEKWISLYSRWTDEDDADAPESSTACRDRTPPFQGHETTSEDEGESEDELDED